MNGDLDNVGNQSEMRDCNSLREKREQGMMSSEETINLGPPSGSRRKAEEGKFRPPLTWRQNSLTIRCLISQTEFKDAADGFMILMNFIRDTLGIE